MRAARNWLGAQLGALVLVMLTACASIGLPTPQTFNERMAYAIGQVTQTRATAMELLVAKRIDADDAENVQVQADHAMAALALARQMRANDPVGADAKLTATIAALTALQTYLRSKGAP